MEGKVRQHGYSKRRTWRKIHLAITPDGKVRAVEPTQNSISDDEAAIKLLEQEKSRVDVFVGNGAYDKRKVYDSCMRREIPGILIPPGKNARIWQHGNSSIHFWYNDTFPCMDWIIKKCCVRTCCHHFHKF